MLSSSTRSRMDSYRANESGTDAHPNTKSSEANVTTPRSKSLIQTKSSSTSFGLVPPDTPRLFQLHQGSSVYTLQPDMPYTIGSDSSATIQVLSDSPAIRIAPVAARIHNDEFVALDVGCSVNGRQALVNQIIQLRDGDTIKLGLPVAGAGGGGSVKFLHLTRLSAMASAKQNLSLQHQGDPLAASTYYQQQKLLQQQSRNINASAMGSSNTDAIPIATRSAMPQHETFHSQTIRSGTSPSNSSFLQQHVIEKEDSALPIVTQSNTNLSTDLSDNIEQDSSFSSATGGSSQINSSISGNANAVPPAAPASDSGRTRTNSDSGVRFQHSQPQLHKILESPTPPEIASDPALSK